MQHMGQDSSFRGGSLTPQGDRDKRVDSLALSERVTDLPGAPQVEVRLKKKFET